MPVRTEKLKKELPSKIETEERTGTAQSLESRENTITILIPTYYEAGHQNSGGTLKPLSEKLCITCRDQGGLDRGNSRIAEKESGVTVTATPLLQLVVLTRVFLQPATLNSARRLNRQADSL